MPEVWYAIATVMLTAYVVLDGFDLGAGVLHLLVAKKDAERRQVLAAIGPFWDGNEVWLLAAGGALFVGFPRVLASGISGFYFAIFLVLWCLIIRGVSIEFRSHVDDPLWRASWDFFFFLPSALLPVFLGAALGNLLRGVPLDEDGWFALALFTDFSPRAPVGILDWYTVLVGVFALVALAAHGAVFLSWKTDGEVQARSRSLGGRLYAGVALLWPVVTLATQRVHDGFLASLAARPLAWLLAALALAGLATVFAGLARRRELFAFLGSCSFLAGLSTATAVCVFPTMLLDIGGEAATLTAYNAAGDPAGLRTALHWFAVGFPLAIAYLVFLFRLHRGKAAAARGEGYWTDKTRPHRRLSSAARRSETRHLPRAAIGVRTSPRRGPQQGDSRKKDLRISTSSDTLTLSQIGLVGPENGGGHGHGPGERSPRACDFRGAVRPRAVHAMG